MKNGNRPFAQAETWLTMSVVIGNMPTPRHFPAVRISMREERHSDRSLKNCFSYTLGLVETRDDVEGKTFRPITHVRDANVVAYLDLMRAAATMVARQASKADKRASGTLSAPAIEVAVMSRTDAAPKVSGNRASRREQARRAAVYTDPGVEGERS